ncbi:MAG TPA: Hsp20/alpha crystallin family protein [Acidobacteriota bacterium]|nr:Hsp20/alpha crystallin family protein [Acidobacteriota bacterium]
MAEKKRSEEREKEGLERLERLPFRWRGGPFALMNRFAEEMDRLFEDFGFGHRRRSWPMPRGFGEFRGMWSPDIEVFEREGKFVICADLPGLRREDVNVEITDNEVIIQGERRHEHEEEKGGYYRSERSYGTFYRSIPLPEDVKADEAQASFRDGVLEITMPAPERTARRRRLEIQEAGKERQREEEPARR